VEVEWSVSTAWADAGESAYVRVLPRGRGASIILSKDRRVKQRWRRSGRARRLAGEAGGAQEDLKGEDQEVAADQVSL
jgi:hypothetical protein